MVGKGYSAETRKRKKGGQVDQVGNDDLAEMTEALENASANLSSTGVTEPGLMQLSELADQVGASSFIGRIALAGQTSSGSFWVQFNVDGNGGFASSWPGWAFELGKSALVSNKRVWVISNGDPFGSNLVQVLILAT
jgi:hypothetical protein